MMEPVLPRKPPVAAIVPREGGADFCRGDTIRSRVTRRGLPAHPPPARNQIAMPIRPLFLQCLSFLVCFAAPALIGTPTASADLGVTPPSQFSVPKGFEVQLVYEVPSAEQGSWVSLTVDPEGRLLACDQGGGLYRIDVSSDPAKVTPLKADIQSAQGLLFAFDSLYVNVNGRKRGGNGVYRLTDTTGDDEYDKVEHILPLDGGGGHVPHALILSADGQRIITCGGNMTKLPENIARSRVPQVWDEDHLRGRMPDARGHAADRMAPGGWIGSFAPDGSDFELIACGFRNEYDIALNDRGELFSYDADMEWDVGTPWYRPTRVNHVISGAEFGWRNGTGKWPAYYPDSFGAAVDIGPGSPTGICFGYGAEFPQKYQDALFICDWSYGNIHAVHLSPDGSSYAGTYETFATAAPLPVTDITIHPDDGAMYFTIGGRRTQSGLYRITYTGESKQQAGDLASQDKGSVEQVDPTPQPQAEQLRQLRHQLESLHVGEPSADQLPLVLENLGHGDRAIRFAARIALEHQPLERWRDEVLSLTDPQARILGVIALARNQEKGDKGSALAALNTLDWEELSDGQRIDLLRAYGLVALRMGEIKGDEASEILGQLEDRFPTGSNEVDRELAQLLVYLGSEASTAKIVQEMISSPSQENQIHYALTLRNVTEGWTPQLHRQYFDWFNEIQSARGGASFGGFIGNIKQEALKRLPGATKEELAAVIDPPKDTSEETAPPRPFVQKWKVEDLVETASSDSHVPDFERGKDVFAAGDCYKCHRMGTQGGILGPDLTAAGGRFNAKDLLVSMIEPSKEISDQYGATQFLTDDGRVVVGRVVNMSGNTLRVMTNMLDPSGQVGVERDSIITTRPAQSSMMPEGLLDTFSEEEILDLIAYLRAGGRASHPIYKKSVAKN